MRDAARGEALLRIPCRSARVTHLRVRFRGSIGVPILVPNT